MKNDEYVTYEQAVKLKEYGFNYPCKRFYTEEESLGGYAWLGIGDDELNHNAICYRFSVPTIHQAAKWIREEKKLDIDVPSDFQKDAIAQVWKRIYFYELWDNFKPTQLACSFSTPSDTYEEALSAGISKALEIINCKTE